MSELNVYHHELRHNEYAEFCLKYEVDKVIAEKDKQIAELEDKLQAADKQIENLINSASSIMLAQDSVNDNKCAELRHQKYRRCLAMYRYCAIKALYGLDCKGDDVEWKWYSKWMHKWFKLAEKFKEAK